MRIKIIGDNNCARATRHLLRLGGFAVTEFLPADALAGGPLAGYAITIDLAPANHSPDACLRPDSPTLHARPSHSEEAARLNRDASSPAFADTVSGEVALESGVADGPLLAGEAGGDRGAGGGAESVVGTATVDGAATIDGTATVISIAGRVGAASPLPAARIHFDSVDSELEAAVLRHVTQLAAAPVVVDRPGGVVHSDRELRIVVPNSGDAVADDAAAVAVEFGVLRGLLDLMAGARGGRGNLAGEETAGDRGLAAVAARKSGLRKKWWPFGIVLILCGLGVFRGASAVGVERVPELFWGARKLPFANAQGKKSAPLRLESLRSGLLESGIVSLAQGQFDTGQGLKITDGNNFLVVDPCLGQAKLFASINQTANTQLVSGTVSKKIYVCSIHLVAAAATNVAVVEGTGSVCGTGTAGVSGFGGATAATGWNFAANGGIALGNGASALGAEGTSGDNLCLLNSGSGQVSGGISYVLQ